ncbi:hypothetical protein [Emergencia sp.]|uniref:hypothetical protein n=1 Tax=Emergencia sp. TaxID=1926557 RepID=UPI003AF131C3
MIRTKCSNCGNIRYIKDNDDSFMSCPNCNAVFTQTDRDKWKKIRDLTKDDTPKISQIFLFCLLFIGVLSVIGCFVIGSNTGYYGEFNTLTFLVSIVIVAESMLVLIVFKNILDTLYRNQVETQTIREFMEYEISKQLEERK